MNPFVKEITLVGIRKEMNTYIDKKGKEVNQYIIDVYSEYDEKYIGYHVSSAYISTEVVGEYNLSDMIGQTLKVSCSYFKPLKRLYIEKIIEVVGE